MVAGPSNESEKPGGLIGKDTDGDSGRQARTRL